MVRHSSVPFLVPVLVAVMAMLVNCTVSPAQTPSAPSAATPTVSIPTPTPPPVPSAAVSTPVPKAIPKPSPAPTPEFRVRSLTIIPKETVPGDNVTVNVSVENIGKAEGTYRASLNVDGKVVETKDVFLAAGARQDIAFKISANAPGTNTIKLGELEGSLRILRPAKFRVTRLDANPNLIRTGENMTVNIDLENEGEANGTHSLSLILDGKVIATKDVAAGGGATQSANFIISQNLPGIHNIEVEGLKGIVRVIDYVRPRSGTYLMGKEYPPGPVAYSLSVTNRLDLDVVVIVTRSLVAPKTPVVAVYIRAQEHYPIFVLGNDYYSVYFTFGKDWDNYTKEFATDRELMWFPEKLDSFRYLSFGEIRLVKDTQSKNLKPIKEEEFPKLS